MRDSSLKGQFLNDYTTTVFVHRKLHNYLRCLAIIINLQ